MRFRSLSLFVASIVTMSALLTGAACSSLSADQPAVAPAPDGGADGAVSDQDAAVTTDGDSLESSTKVRPVELASTQGVLTGVAASETLAYFAVRSTGMVRAVQLESISGVQDVAKVGQTAPTRLAFTDGALFWSDAANTTLGKLDGLGGQSSVVSGLSPVALAAGSTPAATTVVSLGPTGTAEVVKVRQFTANLTLSGETTAEYATAVDVAIAGDKIWWTEPGPGVVWVSPVGLASPVHAAIGEPGCESIAADVLGVYWARPADGLVRMFAPAQAMAQTIAVKQPGAFSVVSDASGVYWLTTDGKLQRSGRQATELPPQTIAKGFATLFNDKNVRAIALTSKYIVWITSDGKVLRQNK